MTLRRAGRFAAPPPARSAPVAWPEEAGDLARAQESVVAAGGDEAAFRAALGAGLDAAPEEPDAESAVALAGLAAWRAGVVSLRGDALGRLASLAAGPLRAAAAATLVLDEDDLDGFVRHQEEDPFWWPGREAAGGYVCAIGGFSGLGGPWTAPPVEWRALDAPGAFAVRAGEDWWRADADAWGAVLARMDAEPPASGPAGPARIVLRADSYLAWIRVAEAA